MNTTTDVATNNSACVAERKKARSETTRQIISERLDREVYQSIMDRSMERQHNKDVTKRQVAHE